jgi:hypothetical protein
VWSWSRLSGSDTKHRAARKRCAFFFLFPGHERWLRAAQIAPNLSYRGGLSLKFSWGAVALPSDASENPRH